MCRGGKDGVIKRCKGNKAKRQAAALRKKVKYRADKENVSVDTWKQQHPEALESLIQGSMDAKPNSPSSYGFQDVIERRTLPQTVPMLIAEHMKQSKTHIDANYTPEEAQLMTQYASFTAGVCNTALLDGNDNRISYYDAEEAKGRMKGPSDFADRQELVDYIESMDTILAPRNEESKIVYRGLPIFTSIHKDMEATVGREIKASDTDSMVAGLQEYYKIGKVFDYGTYLSTSHSAHYAADRTNDSTDTEIDYYDPPEIRGLMFEMKTNAGVDVTGVARHNSYEREVVLPRGTRFKVVGATFKPASYDTVSGYDYMDAPDTVEADNFTSIAGVIQMVEVDEYGEEITHREAHVPGPVDWK